MLNPDLQEASAKFMANSKEQVKLFKEESWHYFNRNYKGRDLRTIPLNKKIDQLFRIYPLDLKGAAILEIGCGAANNLHQIKKIFGDIRCVGTEPSPGIVDLLKKEFPEIEFQQSDSLSLPFYTDEFDLVILRSVLHWVDRNYLLQTIGEAIRVTKTYLLISDFAPTQQYSVIYHHNPNYRTYKIRYSPLVEASGFMNIVVSFQLHEENNWRSTQTVLFKKIPLEEAFPLRTEEHFNKTNEV